MVQVRLLQALSFLGVTSGGILIWLAFQPENLMCPHERIIEACNPNFFYLIPGFLILLVGLGLAGFIYQRSSPVANP
ncbi:hypothetical protein SAMN04487950_2844 [Halogranum rubrum]|uniref:Uncharacterized protein n=1 Tax=Halogranum rubrum TaxID=553466 RepID=A0A1I4FWZ8_9EURY|nr:hypothetical protein SAMN04487950_2844 [Halogranum rubrum]